MSVGRYVLLALASLGCNEGTAPPTCSPPKFLLALGPANIIRVDDSGCWLGIERQKGTNELALASIDGRANQRLTSDGARWGFSGGAIVFEENALSATHRLFRAELAKTESPKLIAADEGAFYFSGEGRYLIYVAGSDQSNLVIGSVESWDAMSGAGIHLADGAVLMVADDSALVLENITQAANPCSDPTGVLAWHPLDGSAALAVGGTEKGNATFISAHPVSRAVVYEAQESDGMRHVYESSPGANGGVELFRLPQRTPDGSNCDGMTAAVSWSPAGDVAVVSLGLRQGDSTQVSATQTAFSLPSPSPAATIACSIVDTVAIFATELLCMVDDATPGRLLAWMGFDGTAQGAVDKNVVATTQIAGGRIVYQRFAPELPRLPDGNYVSQIRITDATRSTETLANGYLENVVAASGGEWLLFSDVLYSNAPDLARWSALELPERSKIDLPCHLRPVGILAAGEGTLLQDTSGQFYVAAVTASCSK